MGRRCYGGEKKKKSSTPKRKIKALSQIVQDKVPVVSCASSVINTMNSKLIELILLQEKKMTTLSQRVDL
jgi:hypothetical protein